MADIVKVTSAELHRALHESAVAHHDMRQAAARHAEQHARKLEELRVKAGHDNAIQHGIEAANKPL